MEPKMQPNDIEVEPILIATIVEVVLRKLQMILLKNVKTMF